MGNSFSENVATQVQSDLVSVAQSFYASIASQATSAQSTAIQASGDIIIRNTTFNQTQVVVYNIQVASSATFSTSLNSALQTAATQIAQAEADFLSMSGAEANNLATAIQNLAINIGQACTLSVTSMLSNTQSLSFTSTNGEVVFASVTVNQKQTISDIQKTIVSYSSVVSSKTSLVNVVNTSTKAQTVGPLGDLSKYAAAIAVIVVVFLILILFANKKGYIPDATKTTTAATLPTVASGTMPVKSPKV